TVFKFYLQVWVLFSVVGGACLARVLAEFAQWKSNTRSLWLGGLTVLVAGAALYTVMAASAKVRDRMAEAAPRTLDGMQYMKYASYWDRDQELHLVNDYDAIRWMQANVVGSPVIVETNTVEYHWGSRFTIYTGLPGVVGWNWHQRQQRAVVPSTLVTDRVQEIEVFYLSPSPDDAMSFLRKYDVKYIVVGDLERAYYTPEGLAKFDAMVANGELKIAYKGAGGTKIYETTGS
ncbi:MAG: hypothetical protein HY023_06895, partial [Chloroflexi bacterium]|nr:hypothetical protein [Chloroflexota bacterium]